MVVVGIIAILVSMLLPAVQKARLAAMDLKCQSNMGQIARAVFAFASTHDGRAPGAAHIKSLTAPGGSQAWQDVLSIEIFDSPGYVARLRNATADKNAKIICPAATMESDPSKGSYRYFAMNGSLLGVGNLGIPMENPERMNGVWAKVLGGSWYVDSYRLGSKLNYFKNSGSKYMVVENDQGRETIVSSTQMILNDAAYPFVPWDANSGAFSFRHPKFHTNIVFMDGHTESFAFDPYLALPQYMSPTY